MSNVSLEEIQGLFGNIVARAVGALSRRKGEEYRGYIFRVSLDPWARQVKIADLKDNLDPDRLPAGVPADGWWMERYRKALRFLEEGGLRREK